jgi:hypothetical protein
LQALCFRLLFTKRQYGTVEHIPFSADFFRTLFSLP